MLTFFDTKGQRWQKPEQAEEAILTHRWGSASTRHVPQAPSGRLPTQRAAEQALGIHQQPTFDYVRARNADGVPVNSGDGCLVRHPSGDVYLLVRHGDYGYVMRVVQVD